MAAGRENRQASGHRAADMKQRKAVQGDIQFVQPVNLRKAPGGMNLISMRQANELRTSGRSAGVKERTHRLPIIRWLEIKRFSLTRDRLVEADESTRQTSAFSHDQNLLQRCYARGDVVRFGPDRGSAGSDGMTRTVASCASSRSAIASSLRR